MKRPDQAKIDPGTLNEFAVNKKLAWNVPVDELVRVYREYRQVKVQRVGV